MAVMVAALSAVTLLQGCGEDDDMVVAGAWMPVGAGTLPMMVLGAGFGGGAAGGGGGGGQSVTAATAGAVAAGAGGGGGQVSGGGVP